MNTTTRAMNRLATGLVLLAAVTLSGCWESSNVTMHKPGQYKGSKDPLNKADVAERDEVLRKRFELVQVDR